LLALGRLCNGLETNVLPVLTEYIPPSVDSALAFLRMAARKGSASAACMCAQILQGKDGM
jgi:hypothetical protein